MDVMETIINDLRSLKPELSSRFFVDTIGLFGSITRNDFTEESDIDIIVEFNKPVGIEFIDLADFLENRFKRKVDLVSRRGIKDRFFDEIKNEIKYV